VYVMWNIILTYYDLSLTNRTPDEIAGLLTSWICTDFCDVFGQWKLLLRVCGKVSLNADDQVLISEGEGIES